MGREELLLLRDWAEHTEIGARILQRDISVVTAEFQKRGATEHRPGLEKAAVLAAELQELIANAIRDGFHEINSRAVDVLTTYGQENR